MQLTPLILSRLQFAWVISFHILLPAFTVGLASYIAVLEGLFLITKKPIYLRVSMFWIKIFAISFGMGVVSGIVMPFQFGTNWSRYADAVANVLSPLFAYEGLTAFFLEAAFLGVLLFGRRLVPPWAHFISAVMVAAGTLISTFWILAANSWMQTPNGFRIEDGRFFPVSWLHIIFNPSFPFRFMHNVNGFYITTAFVVLAVAAYHIRKMKFLEEARLMFAMAIGLLIFLVPLQMILGDMHGLNTLKYQPTKLAAIEAHWNPETRVPLTLFAIPDQKNEMNHYSLEIPLIGSIILTHQLDRVVPGLKEVPPDQRPPVAIPFFSFRIMVGLGILMLGIVLAAIYLYWRKRIYETPWFLKLCVYSAPIGFLAILSGWVTTEVGRQPWSVYGLLRTAESVTPSLRTVDVILSLTGYLIVYLFIFPFGVFLMKRIVQKGPSLAMDANAPIEGMQPSAPVLTPPEYNHHDD